MRSLWFCLCWLLLLMPVEAQTWTLKKRFLHEKIDGKGVFEHDRCRLTITGNQIVVVGLERGRTLFQTVYDFDELPPRLSPGQSFTWRCQIRHQVFDRRTDWRDWIALRGEGMCQEGSVAAFGKKWHASTGLQAPPVQSIVVPIQIPQNCNFERLGFLLESSEFGYGRYWINWSYHRDSPSPAPVTTTPTAPPQAQRSGRVSFSEGKVQIHRARGGIVAAQAGSSLANGDRVESGPDGSFVVETVDSGNVVSFGPNSSFVLVSAGDANTGPTARIEGVAHWKHRGGPGPSALLGQSVAQFDGTEALLQSSAQRAEVSVREGKVRLIRGSSQVEVGPGQWSRWSPQTGLEGPVQLDADEFRRSLAQLRPGSTREQGWRRLQGAQAQLDFPPGWKRLGVSSPALLVCEPGSEASRATCVVVSTSAIAPGQTLEQSVDQSLEKTRSVRQDMKVIERGSHYLAGQPALYLDLAMTLESGRRIRMLNWSVLYQGVRYHVYAQSPEGEFSQKRQLLERILSSLRFVQQ